MGYIERMYLNDHKKLVKAQHEWTHEKQVPILNFKKDWKIRIIPSFGGCMIRFIVYKNEKSVSVYFDVNDSMGIMGEPYWEMYPYKDDTYRFLLGEEDKLIEYIEEELCHATEE